MEVRQMAAVDFWVLIKEVQDKLCKIPLGQMFQPKVSRQEIENWFYRLAENYEASNGVYLCLYLDESSFDNATDVIIKQACRELLPETERVLLYYSW